MVCPVELVLIDGSLHLSWSKSGEGESTKWRTSLESDSGNLVPSRMYYRLSPCFPSLILSKETSVETLQPLHKLQPYKDRVPQANADESGALLGLQPKYVVSRIAWPTPQSNNGKSSTEKLSNKTVWAWWERGESMVRAWWERGESVVRAWWERGESVVRAWWECGESVVRAWTSLTSEFWPAPLVPFPDVATFWWDCYFVVAVSGAFLPPP